MAKIHISTVLGDHYYTEAEGVQRVWQTIESGRALEIQGQTGPTMQAIFNPATVVLVNTTGGS
jgi:hypothetical protein